jgi:hypothetical protein
VVTATAQLVTPWIEDDPGAEYVRKLDGGPLAGLLAAYVFRLGADNACWSAAVYDWRKSVGSGENIQSPDGPWFTAAEAARDAADAALVAMGAALGWTPPPDALSIEIAGPWGMARVYLDGDELVARIADRRVVVARADEVADTDDRRTYARICGAFARAVVENTACNSEEPAWAPEPEEPEVPPFEPGFPTDEEGAIFNFYGATAGTFGANVITNTLAGAPYFVGADTVAEALSRGELWWRWAGTRSAGSNLIECSRGRAIEFARVLRAAGVRFDVHGFHEDIPF